MSESHVVKQGEHLSRIAEQCGFVDYATIWNYPANSELKQKRKTPHVLHPGDTLVIPDSEQKKEPCATGQVHVFCVNRNKLALHLRLQDPTWTPIGSEACDLGVEAQQHRLTTDGDGLIRLGIARSAEQAHLHFGDFEAPVLIGHLDPIDTVSGQVGRLNNLGYRAGPLDGSDAQLLRSAIEEFQCDHQLTVDGICGPKTQAKVKEIHGS
jgi:hypothetical protein